MENKSTDLSHFNFSHRGCDLCRAVRTHTIEEMLLRGFEGYQVPVLPQAGLFWVSGSMPAGSPEHG